MTDVDARLANANGGVTRCDGCDRPFAGRMHVVMEPGDMHWFVCDECLSRVMDENRLR
jgi:hypothetical protein